MQTAAKKQLAGDTLTIVSIAIVAYILSNVLHEAAGHGGACLAVGGKPTLLTTVNMECSVDSRLVYAGGTLANFAAALLFFVLGRGTSQRAAAWKYFFWIAMAVDLFMASGYFAFSGIGGFGDWAGFIEGLGPRIPWRIGMTLFGVVAYMLSASFVLREMRPLIGSLRDLRQVRAVELTKLPYFAGGILACIAGALNPAGLILVALSAAASTFGGASGLLWMTQWLHGSRVPLGAEPEPGPILRSWGWIVTASVMACLWIAVLGPGLHFKALTLGRTRRLRLRLAGSFLGRLLLPPRQAALILLGQLRYLRFRGRCGGCDADRYCYLSRGLSEGLRRLDQSALRLFLRFLFLCHVMSDVVRLRISRV